MTKDEVILGQGNCAVPQAVFAPTRDLQFARVVAVPTEERDGRLDLDDSADPPGIDVTSDHPNPLAMSSLRPARALLFRQQWWPMGHSLGDIAYSLPLAPGESVDLAHIEWSRVDRVERDDATSSYEELRHQQRRDRTIDESVDAGLSESQWGFSAMGGVAHGSEGSASATVPIYGVPVNLAGSTKDNAALGGSISYTRGDRDIEAASSQELHDRIRQGTSVVRSLASTVIVEATQAETSRAETRTVTNYNRCHTLTVQYYEVLRNFRLETRYKGSLPVALVPYRPFAFEARTALRWRAALRPALLESALADGFDALARRVHAPSAAPPGDGGGTPVSPPTPRLTSISVTVRSGSRGDAAQEGTTNDDATWGRVWIHLQLADGSEPLVWFKEAVGWSGTGSDGAAGQAIKVGSRAITVPVTASSPLAGVDPTKINSVKVTWYEANGNDMWNFNGMSVRFQASGGPAPAGTLLIHGQEAYSGQPVMRFDDSWGSNQTWIGPAVTQWDDVEEPEEPPVEPPANAPGPVPQPPDDRAIGDLLVGHLNDNQAYYNRVVWLGQDPGERRMMLERAFGGASGSWALLHEQPIAASGRWVAYAADSVPVLASNGPAAIVDLLALPSRGLFAEAHLGHCSACEVRDVTRTLDWTPRTPPQITNITPGPQGQAPSVTPTGLPAPVVAISQTPAAPDPMGLAAALQLLGTPGIFRDMSGLTQVGHLLDQLIAGAVPSGAVQDLAREARAALQNAAAPGTPGTGGTAGRAPASEADAARQVDRLRAIQSAKDAGLIDDQQATDASLGVLGGEAGSADLQQAAYGVGDSAYWAELLTFVPPNAQLTALQPRGISIVPLSAGWGDVNLDYYPVRISKLPTVGGQQLDPAGFFEYVRLHLNDYVDTSNSEFTPLDPAVDKPRWESSDPIGTVINIKVNTGDLLGLPPWKASIDQSLVVCTRHTDRHWVFSTGRGGPAAGHPVSGNRMWAIDEKGSEWIFYTMGADRATSFLDWNANAVDLLWRGADALWRSLQVGVAKFVNDNGGVAEIRPVHSRRYDWNRVRQLLGIDGTNA